MAAIFHCSDWSRRNAIFDMHQNDWTTTDLNDNELMERINDSHNMDDGGSVTSPSNTVDGNTVGTATAAAGMKQNCRGRTSSAMRMSPGTNEPDHCKESGCPSQLERPKHQRTITGSNWFSSNRTLMRASERKLKISSHTLSIGDHHHHQHHRCRRRPQLSGFACAIISTVCVLAFASTVAVSVEATHGWNSGSSAMVDADSRGADDADLSSTSSEKCSRTVDIYQSVESPPVTERNRGKPLHCSYKIRVRPARDDWVVFVRFTRMRVGVPADGRTSCQGGYVQIVDGYTRESNVSNRENPGSYCGEIDSPKTFISETPHVKIVFHVDSYDYDSYMLFEATVKQQTEVSSRYGQYSNLYPNRRGITVQNTYCHRLFKDCSPGRCFVQSPGYPGIYPRSLACKYRVNVRGQSLVGLDLNFFDVDGLRCDNLLMCFPRPIISIADGKETGKALGADSTVNADLGITHGINTNAGDTCPYDYVRIHDGPSEDHPVITTLCGRGRLKSNIVASGSEMLVTFITSPAGPLLNTGFHFKADSVYDAGEGETIQLRNGACIIERTVSATPHLFNSPRSWYPINTSCQYRFTAPLGEIIRLEFTQFRVERVTFCEEAIRIYDSHEIDPRYIITKLCDTNRPRTEQPRSTFESTSNKLLVDFSSTSGSLDGASISFSFEVRHISAAAFQNRLSPMNCNKRYKVARGDTHSRGSYTLMYKDFLAHSQPIACNYSFDATSWPHGRVELTIGSAFELRTNNCERDCPLRGSGMGGSWGPGPGRIEIFAESPKHDGSVCLCRLGGSFRTHRVVSVGPHLELGLDLRQHMEWSRSSSSLAALGGRDNDRMLELSFAFYSDTRCGPERLGLDLQGSLQFPPVAHSMSPHPVTSPATRDRQPTTSPDSERHDTPLYCRWTAPLLSKHDVSFRLQSFNAPPNTNCSSNYLLIDDVVMCPNPPVSHSVLLHRDNIASQQVPIEFRSTLGADALNFSLWWTQVKILPKPSSPDTLVSLSGDCEFLCAQSMVCIRRELVCNGVPNCPSRVPGTGPADQLKPLDNAEASAYRLLDTVAADEDDELCQGLAAKMQMYWWIIGSALGICGVLSVAFIITVARRCRSKLSVEMKEEDSF